MDPFGQVIHSNHLRYMCLLITSTQDPYERLWCVYELDAALCVMSELAADDERSASFVVTEFSQQAWDDYRARIIEWASGLSEEQLQASHVGPEYEYYRKAIKCEEAKCGSKDDETMIRERVESGSGWAELNDRMAKFRTPPRPASAPQ